MLTKLKKQILQTLLIQLHGPRRSHKMGTRGVVASIHRSLGILGVQTLK